MLEFAFGLSRQSQCALWSAGHRHAENRFATALESLLPQNPCLWLRTTPRGATNVIRELLAYKFDGAAEHRYLPSGATCAILLSSGPADERVKVSSQRLLAKGRR